MKVQGGRKEEPENGKILRIIVKHRLLLGRVPVLACVQREERDINVLSADRLKFQIRHLNLDIAASAGAIMSIVRSICLLIHTELERTLKKIYG